MIEGVDLTFGVLPSPYRNNKSSDCTGFRPYIVRSYSENNLATDLPTDLFNVSRFPRVFHFQVSLLLCVGVPGDLRHSAPSLDPTGIFYPVGSSMRSVSIPEFSPSPYTSQRYQVSPGTTRYTPSTVLQ